MKRTGFGWFWLIVGLITVLVVGGLAYQAGLTAGAAVSETGATAVTVVPAYGWGFGFGFGWILFPILFFLLIFGIVAAVSGRRRGWGHGHGHGGYGGWGYGPGGRGWDPNGMSPDDLPPPIRSTLERWHAGAHGSAAPTDQGSTTPGAQPPA